MKPIKLLASFVIGTALCTSFQTADAMIDSSQIALGELKCRDFFSKAEEQLGKTTHVDPHGNYRWYMLHGDNEPLIMIEKGYTSKGLSIMFEDQKILGIGVADPKLNILQVIDQVSDTWLSKISTPDGVHVGMSLDEIEAIYGAPDYTKKMGEHTILYKYVSYNGDEYIGFFAYTRNNTVYKMGMGFKDS